MEVVLGSALLRTEVFPSIDVAGREHLIVATKGTWSLPRPGQRPRPVKALPFALTDMHYGKPGETAVRVPHDLAPFKPHCDVLFDACAHAPDAEGVRSMNVAVQVGTMAKSMRVTGSRTWVRGLLGLEPSEAQWFVRMPLHHGLAFGGTRVARDRKGTKGAVFDVHPLNPVGMGWVSKQTTAQAAGLPMPCIEHPEFPITKPDAKHAPVALNAIPASHPERLRHAGTTDAAWQRDVFPFLPEDFDERFHQSAPLDQRIEYPQGGEVVELVNLLPDHAKLRFALPSFNRLSVRVLRRDYSTETPPVHVDTLFFETEAGHFSAVWRTRIPIKRHIGEIDLIAVGPVDPDWWRYRSLGLDTAPGCPGCSAMKTAHVS